MTQTFPFPARSLRVCYWNVEKRIVDAERMSLERHLARLGDVRVDSIAALDASDALPCDLLVVAAQMLAAEDFPQWLSGFRRRIKLQNAIWTPCLILADVGFEVLSGIWSDVTRDNWYFDVMSPSHLASIPIRVANLLRIHDHLHELHRYEAALDDINAKVRALETEVTSLRANGPAT